MERSGALMPQAGGAQNCEPGIQTSKGHCTPAPGGLADRPKHAEVAHGRADRPRASFEHQNAASSLREPVRVGQTDNSGPDDGVIVALAHWWPSSAPAVSRGL